MGKEDLFAGVLIAMFSEGQDLMIECLDSGRQAD